MTTVTLNDEGERRALEAALWHAMRPILDPKDFSPVGDTLHAAADAVAGRTSGVDLCARTDEIDELIRALVALRDAIDGLRSAQLGALTEVSVSKDALSRHLLCVKDGIGHIDGGFWNQPSAVREQLVGTRDGAVRLLRNLAEVEAGVA